MGAEGTPKALIKKVNDDVAGNRASQLPRPASIQRGLDPVFSTPEAFAKQLERARVEVEETAMRAGLYPN